jgi:UDP-N-acetylmuramoylalanine-D-glutamate ligase
LPSVFSNYVERVYKASNIEHAVELAYTVGIQGDATLFCPAVGGYDEDYKQKGEIFSAAVKRL